MRRLILSLLLVSAMSSMVGCHWSHGICDCETDDYCSSRAPWLHCHGTMDAPHAEFSAAPVIADTQVVLPEIKNKGL